MHFYDEIRFSLLKDTIHVQNIDDSISRVFVILSFSQRQYRKVGHFVSDQ